MLLETTTIPQAFRILVPKYKSHVYRNLILTINEFNPKYGDAIGEINRKRAANRIKAYLDIKEITRARIKLSSKGEASIRFGVEKTGRGYHGERADFCLVGGAVTRQQVWIYYRSLELIGGLGYDLCLFSHLWRMLGRPPWKRIVICTPRANVFALKRNSNEKLYPKLQEIFDGH